MLKKRGYQKEEGSYTFIFKDIEVLTSLFFCKNRYNPFHQLCYNEVPDNYQE
jgi:hypothetical protein